MVLTLRIKSFVFFFNGAIYEHMTFQELNKFQINFSFYFNLLSRNIKISTWSTLYAVAGMIEDLPICFRYCSTGSALALASFLPILLRQPVEKQKTTVWVGEGVHLNFTTDLLVESNAETAPIRATVVAGDNLWNRREGIKSKHNHRQRKRSHFWSGRWFIFHIHLRDIIKLILTAFHVRYVHSVRTSYPSHLVSRQQPPPSLWLPWQLTRRRESWDSFKYIGDKSRPRWHQASELPLSAEPTGVLTVLIPRRLFYKHAPLINIEAFSLKMV